MKRCIRKVIIEILVYINKGVREKKKKKKTRTNECSSEVYVTLADSLEHGALHSSNQKRTFCGSSNPQDSSMSRFEVRR